MVNFSIFLLSFISLSLHFFLVIFYSFSPKLQTPIEDWDMCLHVHFILV